VVLISFQFPLSTVKNSDCLPVLPCHGLQSVTEVRHKGSLRDSSGLQSIDRGKDVGLERSCTSTIYTKVVYIGGVNKPQEQKTFF
jgi:hypothetical protein